MQASSQLKGIPTHGVDGRTGFYAEKAEGLLCGVFCAVAERSRIGGARGCFSWSALAVVSARGERRRQPLCLGVRLCICTVRNARSVRTVGDRKLAHERLRKKGHLWGERVLGKTNRGGRIIFRRFGRGYEVVSSSDGVKREREGTRAKVVREMAVIG